MSDSSSSPIDRRRVLKHLGTGSVVGIATTGTATGQRQERGRGRGRRRGRGEVPDHPLEPESTFEPDVGEQPGVETAELTVHEGSITTRVRLDGETLASTASTKDDATGTTHGGGTVTGVRLGLEPDELPRPRNGNGQRAAAATADESSDDLLQVDRERRSVGDVTIQGHVDGMADEPSTGSRDVAVYGQTASQECGPLARTTVRADRTASGGTDNETPSRDHVDGNACQGHEWNGKFEAFCDYLGWIPGYDCGVPSVFDTSWHIEGTGFDGSSAQTLYACYDFPAVPDTVVVAQDVELEDGQPLAVSYESTIGVSTEDEISDYDWDSNGIANLVMDGIGAVLATGGWSQAFTLALSAYLLEQDQGIVSYSSR